MSGFRAYLLPEFNSTEEPKWGGKPFSEKLAELHELEWQAIESAAIPYLSDIAPGGKLYLVSPEDYNQGPRRQSYRPHPDSYRPDLPLRSTAVGLHTVTKEERNQYAARSLDLFAYSGWRDARPGDTDTAARFNRDYQAGKLRHFNIVDHRARQRPANA